VGRLWEGIWSPLSRRSWLSEALCKSSEGHNGPCGGRERSFLLSRVFSRALPSLSALVAQRRDCNYTPHTTQRRDCNYCQHVVEFMSSLIRLDLGQCCLDSLQVCPHALILRFVKNRCFFSNFATFPVRSFTSTPPAASISSDSTFCAQKRVSKSADRRSPPSGIRNLECHAVASVLKPLRQLAPSGSHQGRASLSLFLSLAVSRVLSLVFLFFSIPSFYSDEKSIMWSNLAPTLSKYL